MKKWILGIYRRRLFDEKIEEESNSVVNQKKLIDDYLVDKDDIMTVSYTHLYSFLIRFISLKISFGILD